MSDDGHENRGAKDVAKARGGFARAESLTPEERAASARNAARARWSRALTDASADGGAEDEASAPFGDWGGYLNVMGVQIACYVLDDRRKVILLESAAQLLTGVKGGPSLDKLLAGRALEPFLDIGAFESRLVRFRPFRNTNLTRLFKGLPADFMLEICRGLSSALQASLDLESSHASLTQSQRKMATNACIFLSACAKFGLLAMIDEATGYEYERADSILGQRYADYVEVNRGAWESVLPEELWIEFARLTGGQGTRQDRPAWWSMLIAEMIYGTLDSEVLRFMERNKPPAGGHWRQPGGGSPEVKALVSRCYEIVGMSKGCDSMRDLRERVAAHHGREIVQLTMSAPIPTPRP